MHKQYCYRYSQHVSAVSGRLQGDIVYILEGYKDLALLLYNMWMYFVLLQAAIIIVLADFLDAS